MLQKPRNRPLLGVLLLAAIIPTLMIVGEARGAAWSERGSAADDPPYAQGTPTPKAEIEEINPYYAVGRQTLPDGRVLALDIIGGPPNPPGGLDREATTVNLTRDDAVLLPNFPSYDWVFGCSAVSGAMIAGYYDSQGYPNMYTGPTNGGVMPITDTGWGSWIDGEGVPYPNNPLVASRDGLDGHSGTGSIEDYWVGYGSWDPDPYIGNWAQHTWESAVGDYMKTSQYDYGGNPWNIDGSTTFYSYTDGTQLTCSQMVNYGIAQDDGTYGRKLFYEARGYIIDECFSQWTDNQHLNGFTLDEYQAEIDSGHPVFLNLDGHSVVGFGYDGSDIYIRDTWDSNPLNVYSMTWDGSYAGMQLISVSIVRLVSNAIPGNFGKVEPLDENINVSLSPTISWSISFDADRYEYCYGTDPNIDGTCNGTWEDVGTDRSVDLRGLTSNTTYFWQVRAVNSQGSTYADGSTSDLWQFTTGDPPGAFAKLSPANALIGIANPTTLAWSASDDAAQYEVCLSASADCADWVDNGANTSLMLDGLADGVQYFWQVRAVNDGGVTYADGEEGDFWSFTTQYLVNLPLIVKD